MTNNVVADNEAHSGGSGLYINVSSPRLLHTTVARNVGGDGVGIYVRSGMTASFSAPTLAPPSWRATESGLNYMVIEGLLARALRSPSASSTVLAGILLIAEIGPAAVRALPRGSDLAPNQPRTHFVAANGMDINDCSSPSNACRTVQRAVDVATEGDIIKVATGVYTDGDTAETGYVVALTKTVSLRGGYTTSFAEPPNLVANPTVMDAGGLGRVVIITGDIAPMLDGFILTGGDASALGGALVDGVPADAGGGISIQYASPIIANNIVTGNVASTLSDTMGVGGGISLHSVPASAVIHGNQVLSNIASTGCEGQGGGLYLGESIATISNNTVRHNSGSVASSSAGGGMYVSKSQATIIDNLVQDNISSITADGVGGGIAVFGSNNTVVKDNTVLSNTSSTAGYGKGGGLGFKRNNHLLVTENHVQGNMCSTAAEGRGGGIFLKDTQNATVSNNTVLSNSISGTMGSGFTGESKGGGLYLAWDSHILLTGNHVQGNSAIAVDGGLGGGIFLRSSDATTLTNNVIVHNQANAAGSGLYIQGSSSHMLHTTVARNTGGDGSGICVTNDPKTVYDTVNLTNTILVSHTVGITVAAGSSVTLEATLWGSNAWANDVPWDGAGGISTGTINLWSEPSFVRPDAGDYHILPDSAAINAGTATGIDNDIDGEPRLGAPDVGADEHVVHAYLPLILRTQATSWWSTTPESPSIRPPPG